ncbi:ABC transporter substrate-binding protein [Kibdelosporangium phytohabitans]|uniref:ABC transporter substrate-binding protein n=1 Tax=Kibdelosporangium phytohabitans TaxID=860235 RepID=UPI0009F9A511|nr:ABC transporter substrate-binding protein [Kibdelosporangium phytohabitans]MBE1461214.1 raffinose/stachyose/melibiose transport system substrate-binding protein [Kibdelosporangium phytohabitans]
MRSIYGGRRGTSALVLTAAVSLVLAGCGSSSNDGGGGSGNAPAGDDGKLVGEQEYLNAPCPEPAVKPTQKEFTYWSMWTKDEPQGRVLQKAFKCFEEKAGVKVNVQWLGRKFLTQNVAPALNTDTVPDLIDQDTSQVKAAVVDPGGTQGLDDVFTMKIGEGDKTVKDVIPSVLYDIPQNKDKDGKLFGVPYELLSNGWWYDKNKQKDFKEPKTTDELFAALDKAKAAGGAIAQDGDIDFYNAYFLTQIAEKYVGAGGIQKAVEDKTGGQWKSEPGLLKAAQYVEKLAKGKYFIDGWDAGKFPQIQQRWADGEAAFLFVGSWAPSETREYLGKQGGGATINYGSFQFPKPDDATHDTIEFLPVVWSVTKKAKNPEAAKAFIAYFTNKDLARGIPAVADNLHPRAELPVPDDLKQLNTAFTDSKKEKVVFMDSIDSLVGGTYVKNVFYPLNNDLLKGKITAQQFIDQIGPKTADFWKNQG